MPHFRPPESKFGERNKETLKQLYKKIGAPDVWIWGMGRIRLHPKTMKTWCQIMGHRWVASVVSRALIDFYAKFRETGVFPIEEFEAAPPGPMGAKLQELRKLDFWSDVERRNSK